MIAPSAHRNRHLRSLCELGVLTAQRRRSENFCVESFSENHLRNAQETHKFDRKTAKDALRVYPKPLTLPYLCYLCVLLFKNPFPERSVPILLSGFPLWPSVKHWRHSDQSGTKRNAFVPKRNGLPFHRSIAPWCKNDASSAQLCASNPAFTHASSFAETLGLWWGCGRCNPRGA